MDEIKNTPGAGALTASPVARGDGNRTAERGVDSPLGRGRRKLIQGWSPRSARLRLWPRLCMLVRFLLSGEFSGGDLAIYPPGLLQRAIGRCGGRFVDLVVSLCSDRLIRTPRRREGRAGPVCRARSTDRGFAIPLPYSDRHIMRTRVSRMASTSVLLLADPPPESQFECRRACD